VLSFDRYSRDDVVGEVMVELEHIDLTNTDNAPLSLVREITPRSMKVTLKAHENLIWFYWCAAG
jgi:hypothetical protein